MRWQTTKLIAAFVLFAAASPATAWEGDTLKVGGGGGQEFHDFCGPGEAVVGITYKASKDLNVIWMTCQPMRDGHLEGRPSDHGAKGFYVDTGHGSSQGWIGCPAPMVVQAIYASESAVRVVHDFWLRCRNLVTGEHHNSDWSLTQGGQGGATGNADCGDDAYATGIWGGYGSLVDAIGLVCTVYHSPVASPPPPPPSDNTPKPKLDSPKPDKPPLKINNGDGDQNADNGNGNDSGNGSAGGGASAATDTTIYDQPEGNDVAYLSAGEPVTIVSCNADNWCKISKPRKGWVWGDDLMR